MNKENIKPVFAFINDYEEYNIVKLIQTHFKKILGQPERKLFTYIDNQNKEDFNNKIKEFLLSHVYNKYEKVFIIFKDLSDENLCSINVINDILKTDKIVVITNINDDPKLNKYNLNRPLEILETYLIG
jgi:hypothetical protein